MKVNCVKNHHLVRDHVDVSDLSASKAVLMSVVHVVPKDHVCAHGPSVARVMLMSVTCATTKGLVDAHGLCWHLTTY